MRVLAPVVAGSGLIKVNGGSDVTRYGGDGRVRIDVIDRSELAGLEVHASFALTVGAFMTVFPETVPELAIVSAAGEAISEGSTGPVEVFLPLESPGSQIVTVQARDFEGLVPISVVITPESGDPVVCETEIDMGGGNPSTVDGAVKMPANMPVRVSARTR